MPNDQCQIRVALVYPNTYHVGMSNLGFQTVYDLFNAVNHVICERVFLPNKDYCGKTERITTTESGQSIHDFDIIAFSVSFENDYLNLLAILKKTGLPVFSRDRGDEHPLIIAGGIACFLNPEPIAPFIDCFLLGEAEGIIPRFFEIFEPDTDRKTCLKHLVRHVAGVYVPEFYKAFYHSDETLCKFEPVADVPVEIDRIFLKDISQVPTCSSFLTPDTAFDQTFLIEVSRGCPHGCRFCSAGYVYRPPRFRSVEILEHCLKKGMAMTNKIGLVGAAVSDLPCLAELCNKTDRQDVQISFSSLRADALTPEIVSVLKQSRVKTATIAPDAGSQRMRNVINKGMNEECLLNAAELLVSNDIPNLKLYFMIGLPFETEDDIDAIVILCKKIKKQFLESSRIKKRIGEITVSISPFVPKPFTPFQRVAMDTVQRLKKKIKQIKQGLKRVANVRVHADIPRHAYVQALLSQGDRRVADILILAYANNGNWAKTIKESYVNTDNYIYRERDELLPWEFINQGVDKNFLEWEYKKAKQEKISLPCKMNSCNICGVCKEC